MRRVHWIRSLRIARMCGVYDRGGRQLRYGNVVRVSVRAVGSECKDHVGSESPNVAGDYSGGLPRVHLVKSTIRVTETANLGNAKHSGSGDEFCFTQRAKFSGRTAFGCTVSTAFSPRGSEKRYIYALTCIASDRSTHSQGLVVGMGHDSHQPRTFYRANAAWTHLKS